MTTRAWPTFVQTELRAVARRLMRRERPDHTLQPTALVHEAWMRVAGRPDARGLSHTRFVALAVATMRRVLVDSARRRCAARRDVGRRMDLDDSTPAADRCSRELLVVDDALRRLAEADAELAKLVELRVFGRHGVDEIAALLGMSPRTVKRRWSFARSWLAREIGSHG